MVKFKFSQYWRGSYYNAGDSIPADEKQSKRLLDAGLAYEVFESAEQVEDVLEESVLEIPTMENTKSEIMAYLDSDGIEYDPTLTKSQLLELV
jgi:hypothetical protein